MASSADIPHRYDVTINGEGYILLDSFQDDANAPGKGIYTYTPTFVQRSALGQGYGDNQEDFWLTASQNDWSRGEDQKFFRNDEVGSGRFWRGSGVDARTPGEVRLIRDSVPLTFAANVYGATTFQNLFYTISATNLYEVSTAGAITDEGAHGASGVASNANVDILASDGNFLYMVHAGGDIRKWSGSAFSTFSTDGPQELLFSSPTLYATSSGLLRRFDTAGSASNAHNFKGAEGTTVTNKLFVRAFGGKLLVLREGDVERASELWVYDSVGVSKVGELPPTFDVSDICVASGMAFIIGTNFPRFQEIYYYANGTIGRLWSTTGKPGVGGATIAAWDNGVVFTDPYNSIVRYYDLASGGIFTLFSYTPIVAGRPKLAAGINGVLLTQGGDDVGVFWRSASLVTSGTVTTSLYDFDLSLTKLFRGIKIEYDEGSDGDGGSVDIAYRVGDVDGAYTTLQTGAVSGTEYNLSDISGRAISVKLTLNKGTSTNGPILKRVYVRAVPAVNNYERFQVTLNCTGRERSGHTQAYIDRRDGTSHTKTGLEMATDLRTAASSSIPFEVATKFGTITDAIIENLELKEIRPEEFVAQVTIREV